LGEGGGGEGERSSVKNVTLMTVRVKGYIEKYSIVVVSRASKSDSLESIKSANCSELFVVCSFVIVDM